MKAVMATHTMKAGSTDSREKPRQAGFTLVELMLAMVFVSGLLLAIALLTMQVINIYTKGVTIAAVDQAGQVIAKEFRDTINSSAPENIKPVIVVGSGDTTAGRFCSGSVSYVWNSGGTINSATATANHYTDSPSNRDLRFVKVIDPGATLCSHSDLTPNVDRSKATELLSSVDRNLAIRRLAITVTPVTASSQTIYAFSLVVGTNDAGQFISGQDACQPPTTATDPDEFCAINSFDFTARAGNNLDTGSTDS